MPFIIMQQVTIPPWSIVQRFCIMVQATGSSQVQVIFIPLVTFSILKVQRGTIIMFGAIPGIIPAPVIPIGLVPGIPMPVRSIITVLVMFNPPLAGR
jgi:hypothetical protein